MLSRTTACANCSRNITGCADAAWPYQHPLPARNLREHAVPIAVQRRSAPAPKNSGTGQGKPLRIAGTDAHAHTGIARVFSCEIVLPLTLGGFEQPGIINVQSLPQPVDQSAIVGVIVSEIGDHRASLEQMLRLPMIGIASLTGCQVEWAVRGQQISRSLPNRRANPS